MKIYKVTNTDTGEVRYFSNKSKACIYVGTNTYFLGYKIAKKELCRGHIVEYDDFPDVLNKYIE